MLTAAARAGFAPAAVLLLGLGAAPSASALFLPVPVYRYVNETQVAPRLSLVVGLARSF